MNTEALEKLTEKTLAELSLLREEYKLLLKYTRKPEFKYQGMTFSFRSLSNSDFRELYEERKDRIYAALTIELFALVEQILKGIYKYVYNTDFLKTDKDKNVIHELEIKLNSNIYLPKAGTLIQLGRLRNYIVHQEFSLKKARKNLGITDKNKDLFAALLSITESYIKSISVME